MSETEENLNLKPPDNVSVDSELAWGEEPAPSGWYSDSNEDTNLILMSSDDAKFHVNSVILKLSSSVFRDMLSIPRPHAASDSESTKPHITEEEPIHLSERADVLYLLLDVICPGRGLSIGTRLDVFFSLSLLKLAGQAAIKYDMPSALTSMREFLTSRSSIENHNALALYGFAWDLGFHDEARILSTETLKYNLNAPENQALLETMGAGAFKLLRLHHQRKVIMLNALSEMVGNTSYYPGAASIYGVHRQGTYVPLSFVVPHILTPIYRANSGVQNYGWELMKSEVARNMEERPDGSIFFEAEGQFFFDKKFDALRSTPGMDWRILSREFRHIIESMPKVIDV